jgi:lysylphosphatidylglycerol synthetase-like protein (DUF2156 family)
MRRPHPVTVICAIFAIVSLLMAYRLATAPHLVVHSKTHFSVSSSEYHRSFTRGDSPAIFWTLAAGAFFAALAFSAVAYYVHFRLKLSRPVIQGPAILRWLPLILPGIGVLIFLVAWLVYVLQR